MIDPKTLRQGDRVMVEGCIEVGNEIYVKLGEGPFARYVPTRSVAIASVIEPAFSAGDPVTVLPSATIASRFDGEVVAIEGDYAWVRPVDGPRPLTIPVTEIQRRAVLSAQGGGGGQASHPTKDAAE